MGKIMLNDASKIEHGTVTCSRSTLSVWELSVCDLSDQCAVVRWRRSVRAEG